MADVYIYDHGRSPRGRVFGWGFPAWAGGTISCIETVGLAAFVGEADRRAADYGERFSVPESLRKPAESERTFYDTTNIAKARNAA